MQRVQEAPAEVPHAGESLPELLVGRGPGDELRLARRHPVQPLGQPDIHVERHRRGRQGRDRPVVERHGVLAQALEILLAQPNRGRPQDALVRLLGEPQVEGAETKWVLTWTALPSSTTPMRTVAAARRASWSFRDLSCWPLVSSPSDRAKAVMESSTSTTG